MAQPAPWIPEQDLTLEVAQRCIRTAHPNLNTNSVVELGAGWDNLAILADGTHVFRFPRRRIALEFLEQETRLLPSLAEHLPLPIPQPLGWVSAPEHYPWPFAGYPLLAGTTADRARLDPAQRLALAPRLGHFLRALHDLDPRAFHVRPDSIRRLELPFRIEKTRKLWPAFCELDLGGDSLFEAIVAQLPDPQTWVAGSSSIVHGDLYARHLLVDEGRQLCGVIDWGDVHRGDPAGDLSVAAAFFKGAARAAFFESYGPIDDATWRVARFKGLMHLVALGLYGRETGDADLDWECRRWVEALEEERPGGLDSGRTSGASAG